MGGFTEDDVVGQRQRGAGERVDPLDALARRRGIQIIGGNVIDVARWQVIVRPRQCVDVGNSNF